MRVPGQSHWSHHGERSGRKRSPAPPCRAHRPRHPFPVQSGGPALSVGHQLYLCMAKAQSSAAGLKTVVKPTTHALSLFAARFGATIPDELGLLPVCHSARPGVFHSCPSHRRFGARFTSTILVTGAARMGNYSVRAPVLV
jgi:hypothetical protein